MNPASSSAASTFGRAPARSGVHEADIPAADEHRLNDSEQEKVAAGEHDTEARGDDSGRRQAGDDRSRRVVERNGGARSVCEKASP